MTPVGASKQPVDGFGEQLVERPYGVPVESGLRWFWYRKHQVW